MSFHAKKIKFPFFSFSQFFREKIRIQISSKLILAEKKIGTFYLLSSFFSIDKEDILDRAGKSAQKRADLGQC